MRIRNILTIAFLIATLVPTVMLGWLSYRHGVEREFSEVEDRHLLLAHNLGNALERYHVDLVATFETISDAMHADRQLPQLEQLMNSLNLYSVMLIDSSDGTVKSRVDIKKYPDQTNLSEAERALVDAFARGHKTNLSTVTEGQNGANEILAVRKLGNFVAVGRVSTDYFVRLGKSVSFGEKGHAAIVDQAGNVLAHPLPSWIAARKNIAKVSAVKRMMNGETGIQQFYSPALKGDMIAGLTSVEGPGWGVMIPQPVSEIYAKVYENNHSILITVLAGALIAAIFVVLILKSLALPLERLAHVMLSNAANRKLNRTRIQPNLISIKEVTHFEDNYNEMVDKIAQANRKIERLAFIDSVTDLPNREKFQSIAATALSKCVDEESGGAIIFLDIDNFKEINDLHGHEIGDKLLRHCATKLRYACRSLEKTRKSVTGKNTAEPATVSRMGGDEFTILIPGLTDEDETRAFMMELNTELARSSHELSFVSNCSASMGCARYPLDGGTVEELIKRADIAMYHAKNSGKNKAELFCPEIGTHTGAEIKRDVQLAIDNGELTLEYQPKICSQSRLPVGVEALVRWDSPLHGRLSPDLWIPAIINSPVIANLGDWVINKSMEDMCHWAELGYDLSLSINIGSKHFIAPGFIASLEAATDHHAIDRGMLEIEITEDTLFENTQRAEMILGRIRELGYKVAIDDFGKGYSNIARFAQLPVDVIKIDRSIVDGAEADLRTRAIMTSIVTMAKELDCKTVAEGVETLQQVNFVAKMGADYQQGYFFAKSMPRDELIDWLSQESINPVHEYQGHISAAMG